jgi:hypothetical protein
MVMKRTIFVSKIGADVVAPAHVAGLRFLEEARQQSERERMSAEVVRRGFQLLVGAPNTVVA